MTGSDGADREAVQQSFVHVGPAPTIYAAAGSTDGDAVRQGFYKIDRHEGLIKTYVKPFSPGVHDAVTADDYVWAQFIDNRIVPVGVTPN